MCGFYLFIFHCLALKGKCIFVVMDMLILWLLIQFQFFFSFVKVNNEQLQWSSITHQCLMLIPVSPKHSVIEGENYTTLTVHFQFTVLGVNTLLHTRGIPAAEGIKQGVWVQSVTPKNPKSSLRWHSSSSVSTMDPAWTELSFCNKVLELMINCIFLFFSDFTPALLLLALACSQVSQCVPVMSKGPMTDSCVVYAHSLLQNITDTLTQVQN